MTVDRTLSGPQSFKRFSQIDPKPRKCEVNLPESEPWNTLADVSRETKLYEERVLLILIEVGSYPKDS